MIQYLNILKQADIFEGMNPTQLELIGSYCQEKSFSTGEVIIPEGSDSDELYVIVEGEVDILVNPALVSDQPEEREPVAIATLGRGQSFGEIALVDRGFRSASVLAKQKTRLLILPREELIQLCEAYPQLGYRLMFNLAADLAFKMRNSGLLIREELLYRPRENKKTRKK
jgi:CRP/FNR family cyclic AMP-dependent transcriptional regulator